MQKLQWCFNALFPQNAKSCMCLLIAELFLWNTHFQTRQSSNLKKTIVSLKKRLFCVLHLTCVNWYPRRINNIYLPTYLGSTNLYALFYFDPFISDYEIQAGSCMSVKLLALRPGFSALTVTYQYKEIILKASVTVGAYHPLKVGHNSLSVQRLNKLPVVHRSEALMLLTFSIHLLPQAT